MANPFENAFYLVSPLITVSAIIILVAFLWIKAPKNLSRRLFLLLLLSVGLWSLLIFGMRSGSDTNEALFWEKLLVVPAFAGWVFFYHFTLIYTKNKGQRGILLSSY